MGFLRKVIGLGGDIKKYEQGRKKKGGSSDASDGSSYAGDTGVPEYKRGGKVKRTGIAKVHKGEEVLTSKQAKRYRARGKKR